MCGYITVILLISFIYSLGISVSFFMKEHVDNDEIKIFRRMLIVNMVGILLNFASLMAISYLGPNELTTTLLNKILLIYHVVFAYFIFSYVVLVVLRDSFRKNDTKLITKIGIGATLIMSLLILFMPIVLIKSSDWYSPKGLSIIMACISMGIFAFASIFLMILHGKDTLNNRKKLLPLCFYFIVMICVGFVVHMNPLLFYTTSIGTFYVFLMHNTIFNPDVELLNQFDDELNKHDRFQEEFLTNFSYGVRTSLNDIVGFSDCIIGCDNILDAKGNAKSIVNASHSLIKIIDSALNVTVNDDGNTELENENYHPQDELTHYITMNMSKVLRKGLNFTYKIDSDLPYTLYGNKNCIKKIVGIFLDNACQYTEHGFVRVEVHSKTLKDGYVTLVISVEDSGCGITKGKIDTLFDEEEDSKQNERGLLLAKKLIELMGGRIAVCSEPNRGSKFIAVINQKVVGPKITTHNADESLDLQDVKILLVDDYSSNLNVMARILKRYHANMISTCTSGNDCINSIKSGKKYDLIFLDDMMPQITGTETLKQLKTIPGFHTSTVVVTANAVPGIREVFLEAGFSDYLAKPINQNELVHICNHLLGRKTDSNSIYNGVQDDFDSDGNDKVIPIGGNLEAIVSEYGVLKGVEDKSSSMIYVVPSKKKGVIEERTSSDDTDDHDHSHEDVKTETELDENQEIEFDLGNIHILIVDDSPLNVKIMSKMLDQIGAKNVETCSSGYECLEKVRQGNRYDLIFMDDMMPKMSGVDTIKMLKKNPKFHTPTVVATANSIEGMKEKYLSMGFDDYLSKPISREKLIHLCNQCLSKKDSDKKETKEENIVSVDDDMEKVVSEYMKLKTPDKKKSSSSSEVYDKAYLEKNGCDVDEAIRSLGDVEFYNSTLHLYCVDVQKKWHRITESLKNGDMEEYSIDMHSLKRDSESIGFKKLSQLAHEHELRSKEQNLSYCRENFQELENEYNHVLEVVKKYDENNVI